jgi:hypothetical protein
LELELNDQKLLAERVASRPQKVDRKKKWVEKASILGWVCGEHKKTEPISFKVLYLLFTVQIYSMPI